VEKLFAHYRGDIPTTSYGFRFGAQIFDTFSKESEGPGDCDQGVSITIAIEKNLGN
jgi:hypothetical protein